MKGQWTKVLVFVMVALLLGGCAYSISEVRKNEPHRTVSSTKSPKDMAKCIEYRTRAELGGRAIWATPVVALEERADQIYNVAITLGSHGTVADILVKPSPNGSVVEYRRPYWTTSEKQILEIIEQCTR